ncbi:MAG: SDR family NAD(P)-dependent oxidoreductase [Neomegalonema sp.]|nr:SDR family NAD(P)-dependent oxidoreductase [Neomegalonema sp.]
MRNDAGENSKRFEIKWFEIRTPRPEARLRLICLAHGGGGPQAFHDWGAALPDWIEVVAIALPGRAARHLETPIEEMAALIDALLDEITPILDRPFAFFGHSVGAMIGFAAALALKERALPPPLRVIVSGHASPQAARAARKLHLDDDDTLMAQIGDLGLLPADLLAQDELRQFILPPLRADFRLSETWEPAQTASLDCPLSVFGGREDATVPLADLEGWARHSNARCTQDLFEGGHFFTQSAQAAVLERIWKLLAQDLADLPPSIEQGPSADFPRNQCLHTLFDAAAAQAGDEPALIGIDQTLSFAELQARVDLLARRFAAQGCGPDAIVAVFMATSVDFVIAMLAAMKAGGAYLPLDPATPQIQLAEILAATNPVAIAVDEGTSAQVPGDWQGRCVALTGAGAWAETLAQEPLEIDLAARAQPGPQNLAYAVMTSGTTGKPKGILCPHEGAVNSYWGRALIAPYGEAEREACNVFFVWEVLRPLLWGRPAYVIPDDMIYDPRRLIDFLQTHQITRLLMTPSLFEQVLGVARSERDGVALAERLACLRYIILNGEVVSLPLMRKAAALLPHVALINDYSISECHDVTTGILDPHAYPNARDFAPAGPAMANVRLYVLDEALAPVPWGTVGEVYVAGPTLARGYLGLPEMTAERFLRDPFQPGERMFRTGDIGRLLADGQLEIHGRAKFMVKIRGYTVVPEAVEAAITTHPAIAAAAVVAVEDPQTGQPSHLVAYLSGQGARPDAAALRALRAHLKARVAHYALPSQFIVLDELPLNKATGKLDLKSLPKPEAAPPAPSAALPEQSLTAASAADLRARLASVWEQVLGQAPQDSEDNFFDLGGHSLKAVALVAAIEAAFPVRLNVIDVFAHPTLAAMSARIAEQLGENAPAAPALAQGPNASDGSRDIAVIGMACRFPGADDPQALWRNLEAGRESITQFSDEDLRARGVPEALIGDPSYVKAGAVLNDVAGFEPAFWGLSEREAVLTDPQQRLFLECCWLALEDAGHAAGDLGTGRTGVFGGCYLPSYLIHHLGGPAHLDPGDPTSFHLAETGNDKDYLCARVAYHLGLNGPAINVQTSCSTGLVAIAEAVAAIRSGRCEMALAGASSLTFPQAGYLHVPGHVASPDGHCRSFDAQAGGTVLGDGVGVVVLKRLDLARDEGDQVLALIKGAAVNNDGALRAGFSAPGVSGQREVIRAALRDAGVSAERISYIEAHGTATQVGDPIEIRALSEAFRMDTDARHFCALGSIKPNIGHSNIAAGVAGFIKTVQMLRHRRLPPQINFERPNPDLALESAPFTINAQGSDWIAPQGAPLMAGVSSFGIGGTNAHVIVQEAPQSEKRQAAAIEAPEILVLSARSTASLAKMQTALAERLMQMPTTNLADAAAVLQSGRRSFAHRLAVVAPDPQSAAQALRTAPLPGKVAGKAASSNGRAAFLLSGQGSQHAMMGAGLNRSTPDFARHFDDCTALFAPLIGQDLRQLFDPERSASLLGTASGLQAALFSVDYALAQTLIGWGIVPVALAGHSLGEYVAAALADALDLADAAKLVAVRAAAMQACAPGAMLALDCDEIRARALIDSVSDLSLAAVNSPSDSVIAGPPRAIESAEALAASQGLSARRLHVERAFHSAMMTQAAEAVAEAAAQIHWRAPRIPIASNVTGALITREIWADGRYWHKHMLEPVRFAANIRAVTALAPVALIECGPGRALSRLAAKAQGDAPDPLPVIAAMRHARDERQSDAAALAEALAQGWSAGVQIDWHAYRQGGNQAGAERRQISLPGYAFDRHRCWPDAAPSAPISRHGEDTPGPMRFFAPGFERSPAPVQPKPAEPKDFVLLADDGDARPALFEPLAQRLKSAGHNLRIGARGPSSPEDWARDLAAQSRRAGSDERLRLVYMSDLDRSPDARAPEIAASRMAALLRALAAQSRHLPIELWVIGHNALSTQGEPACPSAAGLLGPLLVAAQEAPDLVTRYIDCDRASLTGDGRALALCADQIAAECLADPARREPILALRGRRRLVEGFDPLVTDPGAAERGRALLAKGPHLITGGLGRIGLTLARHLISLGADVVLTTRSAFPDPKDWPALAQHDPDPRRRQQLRELIAIASGPARLRAARLDVTSALDIWNLLEQMRQDPSGQQGALGGVFHAAGLADLRYLDEITPEIFAAEFAAKTSGTQALARAIETQIEQHGSAPGFVVTFSSLAALLGGLGMSAYMAANRAMDALAQELSAGDQTRWLNINWDDWDFAYGKEQVGAYEKTRAGFAMAPSEGLSALEALLGSEDIAQAVVTTAPLAPRIERWLWRGSDTATPIGGLAPAEASESEASAALSANERVVLSAYRAVLGGAAIGLDDDFFALGGDSLLAVQVALNISRALPDQPPVAIADVFGHPSVRQLAERLESRVAKALSA